MAKGGSLPARQAGGEQVAAHLVRSPKRVTLPDLGVVAFESRHAPGFCGVLQDEYSKFHFVVAGRASWESGSKVYAVAANTLFHIAALVPHRQTDLPGEPVTLYAIHYRPELLPRQLSAELARYPMLPLHLGSSQINQAALARTLVQEMLLEQEMQQFGWEAVLLSRLQDLAVLALRLVGRQDAGGPDHIDGRGESTARIVSYLWHLRSHFYADQTLDNAIAQESKTGSVAPG